MNLLTRYLGREIYFSIGLIFLALIMLFSFLDLIHELNAMGKGQYNIGYVLLFVLLTIPGHIYELFPVAVLIGTIVALVQLAGNSELTIFRASGASLWQMVGALFKIAVPLMILHMLFGEIIAPPSEKLAQQLRLKAQNAQVTLKEFRSGVWVKDEHSFVNIKNLMPDTSLNDINIYRFDDAYHLQSITYAKRAEFIGTGIWQLDEVHETGFSDGSINTEAMPQLQWHSSLTPALLSVLMIVPEQMSAYDLYQYTMHLRENGQLSTRYEIAMWGKLTSPLVLIVMMTLALPFASFRQRSGSMGPMVFIGIVLGLTYHFIGRLFANLGSLNDWQPFFSATAMSGLFLMLAASMLWWSERR